MFLYGLENLSKSRLIRFVSIIYRYLSLYSPSPFASSALPAPPNSLQNSRLNRPPLPPPPLETATSAACTLRLTWPPRTSRRLTSHHHTWLHRTWPRPMSLPRTPPRLTSHLITRTVQCHLTLLIQSPRLSLHRMLITRERKTHHRVRGVNQYQSYHDKKRVQ